MAAWTVLDEQRVWISPRTTAFTVVCDVCSKDAGTYVTVQGSLALEALRTTIECPRGHRVRVEREGR
jgi:hypothetical protein